MSDYLKFMNFLNRNNFPFITKRSGDMYPSWRCVNLRTWYRRYLSLVGTIAPAILNMFCYGEKGPNIGNITVLLNIIKTFYKIKMPENCSMKIFDSVHIFVRLFVFRMLH